ncbi:MAG TPA: hypothetical protein VFW96_01970 [Thermomicrobiales bacterium]|nr:hypothetical protein [Thermomicrobiales bacterium]
MHDPVSPNDGGPTLQVLDVAATPPAVPPAERAALAAERTGRRPDQVAFLDFDLSHYIEEGIFGNVDTHGFGALYRQLNWRELGVVLPRTTVDIRPPRVALLPDEHRLPLSRCADRGHAVLARWSFQRQVTRTVLQRSDLRWIPWTAWESFEAEFQRVVDVLAARKAALLARYDAVREEMRWNFAQIAQESRRRLLGTGSAVPDGFVDEVVASLLAAMPAPAAVERLAVTFEVGTLVLGSEMLAERRRAVEARAALAAVERQATLAALEARRQEHAVQQELWAAEEVARQKVEVAAEEARREATIKERLRQLRLAAEQRRLATLMDPLTEVAQQLHAMVYDVVTSALASLRKNRGHLHGSTARGLRDLIARYRALDITDDAALAAMIADVERELARYAAGERRRDATEIGAVLTDMRAYTYALARQTLDPTASAVVEL